jgi:hypothetical protein
LRTIEASDLLEVKSEVGQIRPVLIETSKGKEVPECGKFYSTADRTPNQQQQQQELCFAAKVFH